MVTELPSPTCSGGYVIDCGGVELGVGGISPHARIIQREEMSRLAIHDLSAGRSSNRHRLPVCY